MIVEDSNGLWTERLPNRAAELRRTQSSRGGTSTSSPQSGETGRHRLQQRQQPMKMQQNYQSECWQRQPVGNKRLYGAPTSWGGSKAAVRLWALHCACTVALCTAVSPPMPLCSSTWPWHWARHCLPPLCNYLCTPALPTALWHRSPCEQYICIVIMQCILHSRR